MSQLADILTDPEVELERFQRESIEAVVGGYAKIEIHADDWNDGMCVWLQEADIVIPFWKHIENDNYNVLNAHMYIKYNGSSMMCDLGKWYAQPDELYKPCVAAEWIFLGPKSERTE